MNRLPFTKYASKALNEGREIAGYLGFKDVSSIFVLLGLYGADGSLASEVLKMHGVTRELIEEAIKEKSKMPKDRRRTVMDTPKTEYLLEIAGELAMKYGCEAIGSEHILMAMIKDGDNEAFRFLEDHKISSEGIYTDILVTAGIDFRSAKNEYNEAISDGGDMEDGAGEYMLLQYSTDLTEKAMLGKLDPMIGRESEMERLMQILCRRTKNNPCLIGDPGVGKTAIVEGLAQRIAEGNMPRILKNKRILSLDLTKVIAGTKFRGEFEERMKRIVTEATQDDSIILFIDEVHTIVGAGGAEGAIDASNILKPSLARGKIKIIGATTNEEYHEYIERDKALDRRFQKINVLEPDVEKTKKMLMNLKPLYESFHNVVIPEEVIDYIIELSNRYIQNMRNPDKSIDIMDEVCVKASLESKNKDDKTLELNNKVKKIIQEKNKAVQEQDFEEASRLKDEQYKLENELSNMIVKKSVKKPLPVITKKQVAKIIELKTKIPIYEVNNDTKALLKKLNKNLKEKILGQDEIINSICAYTRKIYFGFKKDKPYSFLFVGPTGVGKTLFVKEYATSLYGSDNFIRIDMSEYKEEYSISKLLGSAPGYVGYREDNTVMEKIRNHPNCVILLDEIEKASPAVIKVFLQALDEGVVHDAVGRSISFKNAIIFMTSNLGCNNLSIGFMDDNSLNQSLKDFLSVEFLNRIDKVFTFKKLDEVVVKKIINKKLNMLKKQYYDKDINVVFSKKIVDNILVNSNYLEYGARKIDKIIEEEVENYIMEEIICGNSSISVREFSGE